MILMKQRHNSDNELYLHLWVPSCQILEQGDRSYVDVTLDASLSKILVRPRIIIVIHTVVSTPSILHSRVSWLLRAHAAEE